MITNSASVTTPRHSRRAMIENIAREKKNEALVEVELITVSGGEHGPDFSEPGKAPHAQLPMVLNETVSWLDSHLKRR
jgi:hypothetical protein